VDELLQGECLSKELKSGTFSYLRSRRSLTFFVQTNLSVEWQANCSKEFAIVSCGAWMSQEIFRRLSMDFGRENLSIDYMATPDDCRWRDTKRGIMLAISFDVANAFKSLPWPVIRHFWKYFWRKRSRDTTGEFWTTTSWTDGYSMLTRTMYIWGLLRGATFHTGFSLGTNSVKCRIYNNSIILSKFWVNLPLLYNVLCGWYSFGGEGIPRFMKRFFVS